MLHEGEAEEEPLQHLLRRQCLLRQQLAEVEDEVAPLQHLLDRQHHEVEAEEDPLEDLGDQRPAEGGAEGEGDT